jgi:ABC-type nitrate/sulfonate/bicarbonate transport system substrate-binding protein
MQMTGYTSSQAMVGATAVSDTPRRSPRRRRRKLACLVVALGMTSILALSACSSGTSSNQASGGPTAGAGFPKVSPSAGTDIPQITVRMGMRPVANDVIYIVGIKQGWFKDVGITIAPPPYGNKSTFNNAVPLLVNHQLDVEGLDPIPTISTLGNVKNIRFIALSDIFLGYQILAAPDTHAKTVTDFMKQGLSFDDAMKRTLEQLKGQKFTIPPIISDRGFLDAAFGAAGMNMLKDTKVVVTPDANALNLVSNGQVKYATFDGAPFTAQLLGAGWIPLVTPLDLSNNLPPGVDSPAQLLVEPPGIASSAEWTSKNGETVLRFVSVMFRIIHEINADPPGQLRHELDFLNAFAGTSLTLKELQSNITKLDPLIPFESQAPYFEDPKSSLYYKNWFQANVNYNVKKGVLQKGSTYNPDDLIWAGTIYQQLKGLKAQSDQLMSQLKGTKLAADKQQLVDRAKKFYTWYDFLDSYRYLKAAVGS